MEIINFQVEKVEKVENFIFRRILNFQVEKAEKVENGGNALENGILNS